MAKTIKALYQNGVFKPMTKVKLKNRQRVELTIVEGDQLPKRRAKPPRRGVSRPRRVAANPAYRIVGLFKSGVRDLSTHHDRYLYP